MESRRFDTFVQQLSDVGTRRRVLHLFASLPLLGGLNAFRAEDDKVSAKHKHKKKKCAKAGQPTSRKRKKCCKGLVKGADGRCVAPTSNCDVCASGCLYTKVQDAIFAAAEGATIRICPGRYNERLTIGRDVTLIGAGQGSDPAVDTILDGAGTGASTVDISTDNTVGLERLHITGGEAAVDGGGIANFGATLTVTDCTITGNDATNGGGIYHQIDTLTLIGTTISGNSATWGGGIFNAATLNLVNGSSITNNQAEEMGGGIWNLGTVSCSGDSAANENTPDNCVDFGPGTGCGSCGA